MNQISPRLDVLVVGAGPTGLLLAAELFRHGLSVRIVDKAPGPTLWSKAQVIQARTLEILEQMGLADRFLSRGQLLHTLSMYTQDCKRLFHIEIGDIDSAYPFMLSLPQHDTEEVLTQRLAELGVAVERQVRVGGLVQSESVVTVQLLHAHSDSGKPEKEELVRAAYVVGCDGMSSTVRSLLGIEFAGSTYLQRILHADVRIDWPLQHPDDEVVGVVSEHGPLGAFPLPPRAAALGERRYRLVAFDAGLAPTLENFQYLLATRGPQGARVSEPAWMAEHQVHCRLAARFRHGRVFLAGDAAHTHSPATGQGMNAGMQDAFNLAWKLALVHKGLGQSLLLDSYEAERMPVASQLLETTDQVTRGLETLLSLSSSLAQGMRNHLLHFVSNLGLVQRRISRRLTMLDVAYRDSRAVAGHPEWADTEEGPAPGERACDATLQSADEHQPIRLHQALRGTRYKLLLLAGATPSKEGFERLAVISALVHRQFASLVHPLLVVPLSPATQLARSTDARGLVPAIPELSVCPLLLDPGGALHHRYAAYCDSVYLIRPDGHVAYRGQPADAEPLLRYLSQTLA